MAILKSGKPTRISIHHSAVRYNTGDLAELKQRASAHNNYHRANSELWNNTTPGEFGYKWIRYHYMISAKGDLLRTQNSKYVLYANGDGTGANSFNRTAINIMFEGNFSEQQPTDAMMKTAVELIRNLERKYNMNPPVRGHREISGTGTACPGSNLGTSQNGWIKQLIANINDKNYPPVVKPPKPPVAPEPTECEKKVEGLKLQVCALESTTGAQEGEISRLLKQNKSLTKALEEEKELFNEVQEMYSNCAWELARAQAEKVELVTDLNKCKRDLEEGRENFIEKLVDWFRGVLSKILGDRT